MAKSGIWLALLLLVASAGQLSAHVALDSPNGGEELTVGSTFTISWHIVIQHSQLDWDLSYSTTGAFGPWTPIVTDLETGDPTAGSMHSYDWTVPNDVSTQVRVRVQQDNSGTDYEDISQADLSIVLPPACCETAGDATGDGISNITDAVFIIQYIFNNGDSPACCDQGDANGDELVNVTDAVYLIQYIFNDGSSPVCPPVGIPDC